MNSDIMQGIRARMLDGDMQSMCSSCIYQDSNNKVSGRKRQLLKSAINTENFTKTLCASPHYQDFEYSNRHHGLTTRMPVDLQIDLGNTCNSACIMCSPIYSSKLGAEYNQLANIEPVLFQPPTRYKNWADDPALVDKFVAELAELPNIKYIHFLGGETLYLKSFYTICNRLIDLGLAKDISIGTTTNCTVYSEELEYIISNFKHVHLGLSIESMHSVNDYIRYPSTIKNVSINITKFLQLRKDYNLHLSLRITPTIFSIYHIDTIFKLMLEQKITAESCNILHEPSCLRIELLPKDLVAAILDKITQIINDYGLVQTDQTIVNQRREDLIESVNQQVIFEYKYLLENFAVPANVEEERQNLVKYIKAFEQIHKNTISDYLPEYEEFLRAYNY